jgi:tetratricopeptide (TPR) repeat protein
MATSLKLLGGCHLSPAGGESVEISGPRSQTVVAIAALSEPGLTDEKLAEILSEEAREDLSAGGVRTLRFRLPAEVKSLLGAGVNRWRLQDITVDLVELRESGLELRRAGTMADGGSLREALELAAQPLLPDIAAGGDGDTPWLAGQRRMLEDLRVDLLAVAIAWADHRGDPWSSDLRATLRDLRPERLPSRPVVRRTRWSSPPDDVSNIGLADATELIGREHELELLRKRFEEGASSQVIYGEGGIGKSDLALTFVDRYASDYRVCWKLEAETDVELRAGLRRLGRKLGIPSANSSSLIAQEGTDSDQFLADLGDYFRSGFGGRWLLLFDNVERPEALEEVWKHLPGNGHVLITSQWPDWASTGARDLHLWGLRLEDAVALLAEESGRLRKADLEGICQALECHPMLLKHAGVTMKYEGIGPAEYLERLRTRSDEAVRMWPELDLTRRHAITTYRLAIARAVDEEPGAGPLIEIVSFLAPELISESILYEGIAGHVPGLADKAELRRARRSLRSRSLIQDYQRTETFSVHRVMQAVVRLSLRDEEVLDRLRAAVHALLRALPGPDSADANERRRWLAPHIEAVIPHVEREGDDELRSSAAELASHLGRFRRFQSEWPAAEAAHERAVDLSRDDGDRRAAAMRGIRLANVIRQRGRFDEAEMVMATALPALRAAALPDDVDYAYALTVQARILRTKPESAPLEAVPCLDEALEILDRRGEESEGTLELLSRTLNYRAVLLRQLGEYASAEAQSRRGFELLTGWDPEDWMNVDASRQTRPTRLLASHLRAMGNVWRLLGRFRDARKAHEHARQMVADLFDDDHTDVGRCLDSLGRVQREYGDFRVALESFTRAREISDYRFGENYPHAGTALSNIALTLREMGRLDEAMTAAEEAVAIYRRNYGDTWDEGVGELRNEHTAWAVYVRADLLTSIAKGVADPGERAERLDRAERDQRQVFRLRKRIYGRPNHPYLASSLQSLADIAALRGRREEAIALHGKARDIRVDTFGESSYWVAQSDARLGELCDLREDRDRHLLAAERVWAEQLPTGHPWLRHVRRLMADS